MFWYDWASRCLIWCNQHPGQYSQVKTYSNLWIGQEIDILWKQKYIFLQLSYVSKGWGRIRPKRSQVVDQQWNGPKVKDELFNWFGIYKHQHRCKICIFMGKTDTTAAKHKQQTMILVRAIKRKSNCAALHWSFSRTILNLSGPLWLTWNQNLATSLCFRSQRSTCRPCRGVLPFHLNSFFFFTKIRLWPLCPCIVFDRFIHSRHQQLP